MRTHVKNAQLKLSLVTAFVGCTAAAGFAHAGQVATERGAKKLQTECVASESYAAIESCPAGPTQLSGKGARHRTAFKSAPPPRERKKRDDDLAPRTASESMSAGQRDTRSSRLQARSRALLITEITGLERLYRQTPKGDKDRPQLVRRLAEGYVELESAANRDMVEAEIARDDAKRKRQKSAYDKSKKEASKAKAILKEARKNAIRYYRIMKRDYPTYSKIDEVLYYLAYEYEQANELDKARKAYLELIEKKPKSQYVPYAYLAFGELFFNDAMADPSKWALAASAYRKVTEYPAPKNQKYGYARYKLAYVYWNSGEYGKAIQEFRDVIEFGNKFPKLPGAKQLQKVARRDLVPVYAVQGSPKKAYNFFKPLSGDKGGEKAKTLEMLNDLGLAYIDTGHYNEGIELFRDLMVRDKSERLCGYQTQVSHAVQALKANDKVSIRKELDKQLAVRSQFLKGKYPDEAKQECNNRTAELLSETGMSWHLEAVGTGGTRGTGDKQTMSLASYLYQKVVDNFEQSEFETFEFPRIAKSDWPNIYKIRYAMADLLYVQERWADCGPAFDAVVAENPKSAEAPEAAYASVLCYQKMYDLSHQGDSEYEGRGAGPTGARAEKTSKSEVEKFKPKSFSDTQQGMLTAFNRYTCYIKPAKGDRQAYDQYVEVKYARARTYFEAQHWEEASVAFRDIALNHADHDSAIFAAQLYLESLNVLGSKSDPARPSCYSDMGDDVPAFVELYCGTDKYEDNKEQCDLLTRIQCDVQRLRAEKTVEVADQGGPDALTKYKQGGDAYIELWRTYGEEQLSAGGESQCGKMEEILYNAAQSYQAGRLLAKSISVRQILLNPKYGLEDTDVAQRSIYQLGRNYQAIAVYDVAARYLTRYASATKYRGEDADKAVSDAVVLYLGLGDDERAIEAADAFNRNYGRRKPAQAAQIAFAVAAHYAEQEEWSQVTKKLSGSSMSLIDRNATLDVKVQAHALLAKAYGKTRVDRRAKTEYGKVVNAWKDPKKASEAISKEGDAASSQRRLGRALTAVGEAQFYFAEKKRDVVKNVKFPNYKGPGTVKAVTDHINKKVASWVTKKKPLVVDATKEYNKVVNLQPLPPPRWVIASGARVGEMWSTFVKEFRAAPIPDFMKRDYELRTAYYNGLDSKSEPLKQIAKQAYMTCLDYSVEYQYFDEFSRECEKWLAEEYKAEFHLIDEFRGSPNRVNSVLQEKPRPLNADGTPMINQPQVTSGEKPSAAAQSK